MLNLKSLLMELLIIGALSSSILVIISRNPVISVVYLISLFINSALYLIVKGITFVGISYILIYIGAIIVLFLFVIMMINIKLTDIIDVGSHYTKNIPLAIIVSGLLIYELFNVLPIYLNNTTLILDNSILLNIFKDFVLEIQNFVYSLIYPLLKGNINDIHFTSTIQEQTLVTEYLELVEPYYNLNNKNFSFLASNN
jgi:NADH-ubiquinone oxidoreductase chain 6